MKIYVAPQVEMIVFNNALDVLTTSSDVYAFSDNIGGWMEGWEVNGK